MLSSGDALKMRRLASEPTETSAGVAGLNILDTLLVAAFKASLVLKPA